jgi:hypothetical protein
MNTITFRALCMNAEEYNISSNKPPCSIPLAFKTVSREKSYEAGFRAVELEV